MPRLRDFHVHAGGPEEQVVGEDLDAVRTGRTLEAIVRELRARGAADVRTCVFLDKPARRAVEFRADYSCFEVEDRFVVGYGLDYAGRYRNLPYVGALRQQAFARA